MKRSSPDADTVWMEETGLPARPRVSEAYSDSTCDSGVMEVQRIHSGIPVLPEARKTDGVCEAPVAEHCGHHSGRSDLNDGRNADVLPSYDQVQRHLGLREFDGRGMWSVQKPGAQIVRSSSLNNVTQPSHQAGDGTGPRCPTPATDDNATSNGRVCQRPNALISLSKQALLHQMDLLEGDEQLLLAQLRALRREYDTRVAALQPVAVAPPPQHGLSPPLSHPRLPPRHRPPSSTAVRASAPVCPPPAAMYTQSPEALHAPATDLHRRGDRNGRSTAPTPIFAVPSAERQQGMPPPRLRRPFPSSGAAAKPLGNPQGDPARKGPAGSDPAAVRRVPSDFPASKSARLCAAVGPAGGGAKAPEEASPAAAAAVLNMLPKEVLETVLRTGWAALPGGHVVQVL